MAVSIKALCVFADRNTYKDKNGSPQDRGVIHVLNTEFRDRGAQGQTAGCPSKVLQCDGLVAGKVAEELKRAGGAIVVDIEAVEEQYGKNTELRPVRVNATGQKYKLGATGVVIEPK